jgi:hypothetical protein
MALVTRFALMVASSAIWKDASEGKNGTLWHIIGFNKDLSRDKELRYLIGSGTLSRYFAADHVL